MELATWMNRRLLAEFPELQAGYQDLVTLSAPEEPGAHITFGDLLAPRLAAAARVGDSMFLKRACRFLEALLREGDEAVAEVVVTSTLVGLSESETIRATARPHMGPRCLSALTELERWWI